MAVHVEARRRPVRRGGQRPEPARHLVQRDGSPLGERRRRGRDEMADGRRLRGWRRRGDRTVPRPCSDGDGDLRPLATREDQERLPLPARVAHRARPVGTRPRQGRVHLHDRVARRDTTRGRDGVGLDRRDDESSLHGGREREASLRPRLLARPRGACTRGDEDHPDRDQPTSVRHASSTLARGSSARSFMDRPIPELGSSHCARSRRTRIGGGVWLDAARLTYT